MSDRKPYHVFLSHNWPDKQVVELLAECLEDEAGLKPWLDKWNLIPGEPWQEEIEKALNQSETCVVFIGPSGIGPWHHEEMRAALNMRVREPSFRVIPVLLPGATLPERGELPPFLSRLTWVDFRGAEELCKTPAFSRLVAGIRGHAPGRGVAPLPVVVAECPYRGLEAFDEAHARFFFGREALTQHLVESVGSTRFLAVTGPSGSGKSSLARAGLLPKLKGGALPSSGQWVYSVLKPGPHPLQELALSLSAAKQSDDSLSTARELQRHLTEDERSLHMHVRLTLADRPREARHLIFVDQFEEIFTICEVASERAQFINNLRYAVTAADGQTVVLITMRADFLGRAAEQVELAEMLSGRQFVVSPMDESDLRRSVEEPARLAGLTFETGLVERILNVVGSEPGALPLLEHTLLQLCEQRHHNMMTVQAYEDMGGVKGALARHAEGVYKSLSREQQTLARRIFLSLTRPGKGTEDTRRRARLSELVKHPDERDSIDQVVWKLADARLLTTDTVASGELTVDLAHEALIHGWPRLSDWIEKNREALIQHDRLEGTAQEWGTNSRDASLLYRGAVLARAEELRARNELPLSPLEKDFLNASLDAQSVQRRATQRRSWLMGSGTTIGLIMVVLVGVFYVRLQRQQKSERSQQLAAHSLTRLSFDPELSVLLAMEAVSASHTPEAVEALRRSLTEHHMRSVLKAYPDEVLGLAYSPDGTLIATGCKDNIVRVHDARNGELLTVLSGHSDRNESKNLSNGYLYTTIFSGVNAVAFDPTGRLLFTAGADGVAIVWDWRQSVSVARLAGHKKGISKAGFVADGKRVYTFGEDGSVRLWDWQAGEGQADRVTFELEGLGGSDYPKAAISADGQFIAGSVLDKTRSLRVWNTTNKTVVELKGPTKLISTIAISPDNRFVVMGDVDNGLQVWDATTGTSITEMAGHTNIVNDVIFSHDGRFVVTASKDNTAKVWDTKTWRLASTLSGHSGAVEEAVFSQDDQFILTRSEDKTARVWLATTGSNLGVLRGHNDLIRDEAFSPDGKFVTTVSKDKTVRRWEVNNPYQLGEAAGAIFSPDGKFVVTLGNDTARVWERSSGQAKAEYEVKDTSGFFSDDELAISRDGQQVILKGLYTAAVWRWATAAGPGNPVTFSARGSQLLSEEDATVRQAVLSPDSKYLITTHGFEKVIFVWDATTGQKVAEIKESAGLGDVAFSSDGRFVVAAGTYDETTRIWRVGTWERVHALKPEHAKVETWSPDRRLLVSPNGKLIFVSAYDERWRIWDIESGRQICSLPLPGRIESMAFGQDSQQLVTAEDDGTARVWESSTCQPITEVQGHTKTIRSVAFSPDGRFIVTASDDGTARVWDSKIGQRVMDLLGHKGVIMQVVFSSDGRSILTSSPNDGMSLVHNCEVCVTPQELIALARKRVSREITPEERNRFLN